MVAVGNDGLIAEFDGDAWSVVVAASTPAPDLVTVHCKSSGECPALAADGTALRRSAAAAAWEAIDSLPDDGVNSLWAADDGDWFAGSSGLNAGAWRYDGDSWTLAADLDEVRGLGGTSATDMFVVSTAGLLHFDGVQFSPVRTGAPILRMAVSATTVFLSEATGVLLRLERLDTW